MRGVLIHRAKPLIMVYFQEAPLNDGKMTNSGDASNTFLPEIGRRMILTNSDSESMQEIRSMDGQISQVSLDRSKAG